MKSRVSLVSTILTRNPKAEIVLKTHEMTIQESAQALYKLLEDNGII